MSEDTKDPDKKLPEDDEGRLTEETKKEDTKKQPVYKLGKWTEEIEDTLRNLSDCGYTIYDLTSAINDAFDGVNFTLDAVSKKRLEMMQRDEPDLAVTKYLQVGRTIREIANQFRLSLKEAEDLANTSYEGYELWPTQDDHGEIRYILLPLTPSEELELSPRIWKLQRQPEHQAWLWIRFPATNWDQIKIVPLSDVHYGASGHLNEKFLEYIDWIKDNPNVFTFINGDLVENAIRDSIAGAIFESTAMPRKQISEMVEILAPIAHKILWALPGNHEDRTRKHAGFDPLEWICDKLGIPFYNDAVHATIWWGDNKWEFYAQHGRTGSATKGGKMNAAQKPANFMEHVHFVIMGHAHDAICNKVDKIVRNYRSFRLELRHQYIIVCASFYGYFGTYASKHGLAPASEGAITCVLMPDGKYKANTW